MKIEKIEELFISNTIDSKPYQDRLMDFAQFVKAIKQAELEGYKRLSEKIKSILYNELGLDDYYYEIQDKIKELEK